MHLPAQRIHVVIALLLAMCLISFIPGLPGMLKDKNFWIAWALHINAHGLTNAYGSGTDYPPLYQYALWLYAIIEGSEEAIRQHIGYLRIYTLAAD